MIRNSARVFAAGFCLAFFCASMFAQTPPDKLRPHIALVLEGGGALGLAHIGVIKVIEELGIPVDIVVGTSMGAVVGGFYAQGYGAARLEEIALGVDWTGIFSEGVNSSEEGFRNRLDRSRYFASIDFDRRGFKTPGSLLSGRKLLYFLDRSTISEPSMIDFDSLPRRYRAVATDLATGERVVIERGSLADAMRASMGIPGVFTPYLLEGRYLVDGGIVDNLPVGKAKDLGADLVIAVDLLSGTPFALEEFDRNPLDALSRTMDIMIQSNVKKQLPDADLVVTVDLSGYQTADFNKTAQIMACGEKAARDRRSELEAFMAKLGALPPGEADIHPKTLTPIRQVIVEGGDARDRAKIDALFAPIVGLPPNDTATYLDQAVAALEKLGIYESIRVRRTDDEEIPTLLVTLKKRAKPGHSIRLGIEYASTYSDSTVSKLSLTPGIVLQGLTTEDSRLAVNIRILDSPALEASFVQPVGAYFFVEGVLHASQDVDTYSSDSAISYLYQTQAMDIGINVGANPVRWAEVSTGLSYEWMQSDQLPAIRSGSEVGSVPMGHAFFSIRRFDSPVFPTRGISTKLRYDQSLSGGGTSRIFRTLTTEGVYVPSFNIPFSLTIHWKGGSDFSEYADDPTAAPLSYKPDLMDRHLFPGPLEVVERVGSHIAGLGGEIKFQLNWASRAIGIPSFLLFQTATGMVLQDMADIDAVSKSILWDAALGIGARVNDGFGISFRVGVHSGFVRGLRPFVAFDMGSIGY